jgi:hypothetical protein
MDEFIQGLTLRAGATEQALGECQDTLGIKLPSEYVQFVKKSNGTEGFVGEDSYLMMWPVEELPAMNVSYEVQEYAPGLLLFGSDGGGEAYAFDLREERQPIVRVPFVGLSLDDVIPVADTFSGFLKALAEVAD